MTAALSRVHGQIELLHAGDSGRCASCAVEDVDAIDLDPDLVGPDDELDSVVRAERTLVVGALRVPLCLAHTAKAADGGALL